VIVVDVAAVVVVILLGLYTFNATSTTTSRLRQGKGVFQTVVANVVAFWILYGGIKVRRRR